MVDPITVLYSNLICPQDSFFRYTPSKNAMTLKAGLGVIEGH